MRFSGCRTFCGLVAAMAATATGSVSAQTTPPAPGVAYYVASPSDLPPPGSDEVVIPHVAWQSGPIPPGAEGSIPTPTNPPASSTPGGGGTPGPAPVGADPSATADPFEPQPAPRPTPSAAAKPAKPKDFEALATGAYKGVYYANDFSYLDDPNYHGWHLGENLKRIRVGENVVADFGGEYRLRYHAERNHRGLGLTGRDDDFLLQRTRVYGNVVLGDHVRVYGEMLDAYSSYETFAPRPIEENRYDIQNLFVDGLLADGEAGKLTLRGGRQELLYGDQRLVSPLDWANTRRTFDGLRFLYEYENWKVDGFWTRPVARTTATAQSLDPANNNSQFFGVYATGTELHDLGPLSGRTLDLYYLGLLEQDNVLFPGNPDRKLHTVGFRHASGLGQDYKTVLEAAYQFGQYGDADLPHSAGFFVAGLGRAWNDVAWKPEVWGYWDWASGAGQRGNGFEQLFPLGHKYLGFMDLFGRSNIQDFNATFAVKPHKKVTLLAWYHEFFLVRSDTDVAYQVTGAPYNNTPGGDGHLGSEIDLLATVTLSARSDLLVGYSQFWEGGWFRTNPTASGGYVGDANFTYVQYSLRF